MNLLTWAIRLLLGAVFVAAGVLKLRDPSEFALEVSNYHLMPALAPYVAITLPSTELLVGLFLLVLPSRSRWLCAAAQASTLLLLMLTIAVASVVVRGINVSCGCFGGSSGPVTGLIVARDLGLLACSIWLAVEPSISPRADRR